MGELVGKRVRILDVSGRKAVVAGVELDLATPEGSKPHVNKEGVIVSDEGSPEIKLDDGTYIMGYECWWEPVKEGT